MIPTFARKALNIILGLFYGVLVAMAAGFLGGFAIGFGSTMGGMLESTQSLIYGLCGLVGLVLYIYLMIKYRRLVFIQKQ